MELLTPEDVLSQLSPLEVGLCILAAYTHDLGMAMPTEERQQINGVPEGNPDYVKFQNFLDRDFNDEQKTLERLQKSEDPVELRRAEFIHGFMLSEYIRTTHSTAEAERIEHWVNEICTVNEKVVFTYGPANYDYRIDLISIAASHNQSVNWLRDEMAKTGGHERILENNERINFAFPGLLLRLADIMDFDASRTPKILFHHLNSKM